MRRAELVRQLESVAPPFEPSAAREQVVTPPEAAAELLFDALGAGELAGRTVLDLGSGTGRLAIGAALLGAKGVTGVEVDGASVAVARRAAADRGVSVLFAESDVAQWETPAELVVMNPPFGAQRRHADRPFWDTAFRLAERAVYAFSLSDSRTFIARRAVAAGAHVVATRPIAWELPRTFPHHARRRVRLAVDLWAIQTEQSR